MQAMAKQHQGRIDPFFTTLDVFLARNEQDIRNVFAQQRENPRAIGILPTLLLHPAVDIAFAGRVAEKYGLRNEFGYLSHTAIRLMDEVPESSRHYKKEFKQFKEKFNIAGRRGQLEELAQMVSPSTIDRFTFAEFKKHFEVYRYFVYNGATTLPFSQGT